MATNPAVDVDRYLARIGLSAAPSTDLAGLTTLQFAHLAAVPFENIDIIDGLRVEIDTEWSLDKIVGRGRGGWCFELNGAFAALLGALGFDVALLGAAVLLDGPNAVIDHLTLEVTLDEPYLVDVGFGDSFTAPLRLNTPGPQDGGSGTFELIPSSQGTTLTRHDAEGFPEPQFRFKRTHRQLEEFSIASDRLQSDTSLHWHQQPVVTRLLGDGPDRITLRGTTVTRTIDGAAESTEILPETITSVLQREFGIVREATQVADGSD